MYTSREICILNCQRRYFIGYVTVLDSRNRGLEVLQQYIIEDTFIIKIGNIIFRKK